MSHDTLFERALTLSSDAKRLDPRPFARALLARAIARGKLDLGGAWTLSDADVLALERAHGIPAGGWSRLTGVMINGPALEFDHDVLRARVTLEEFDSWSDAYFNDSLLSAFTQRLIPPTTAAGLFLLMGVHPAWGLLLAQSGQGGPTSGAFSDPERFPLDAREAVAFGVFGAIAGVLEALIGLDPGDAYPIEAFAEFVWRSCELGRDHIASRTSLLGEDAIPVLFDVAPSRSAHRRALDFTRDLIDEFLVPTGLVGRFGNQTLCVFPHAIPRDTPIHAHGDLDEVDWLELTRA